MKMGWFFIFISIILVILLAGVQISRVYPIWAKIPDDAYQGEQMSVFHTLVERGNVTIDVVGVYEFNKVIIYKNGERYLLADKFPVSINVMEGDVIEIWVLEEIPGASLVIKDISENMILKYSRTSLPLTKGLHRVGKILLKNDKPD